MAIELRPSLKFHLGVYNLPQTLTPPAIDITSDLINMFNQGYTAVLIFGTLQSTSQDVIFTPPFPCLCADTSIDITPSSKFNGVAWIDYFDDSYIIVRTGHGRNDKGTGSLALYYTNETVQFDVRDGDHSDDDYVRIGCVIFIGTPYLAVVS